MKNFLDAKESLGERGGFLGGAWGIQSRSELRRGRGGGGGSTRRFELREHGVRKVNRRSFNRRQTQSARSEVLEESKFLEEEKKREWSPKYLERLARRAPGLGVDLDLCALVAAEKDGDVDWAQQHGSISHITSKQDDILVCDHALSPHRQKNSEVVKRGLLCWEG